MIESASRPGYVARVIRSSLAALLSLLPAFTAAAAPADDAHPLPTPFPQARYATMSSRSPFTVSTATAGPAPTPGFAAQLYVDGVAHLGKTDFVAIKSKDADNPKVLFLEVGKSSDDGMKVERIQWSEQMGKSTVDVSKGGERATLVFDQAQVASQPPNLVPPGMPGRFGPGPGRQFGFNGQSGPGFGPRFYPQRPGQPQAGPPTDFNPAQRRIRGVIQSGP